MLIKARRLVVTIALLSAVAGFSFGQGNSEKASRRAIEVTGIGIAHAAPTLARVQLGVQSRSPDVKTALAHNAAGMQALLAALKAAGVSGRDIATSEYQVLYVPEEGTPGASRPGYYEVTTSVTVTVREIERLGSILDDSFAAGANLSGGIAFGISDSAALEAEARAKAFADAKGRAEELARLAGVGLGRAERITELGGLPSVRPVFAAAGMAPPVSAGELTVQISLQVLFPIE